jgi:2',3'-cyclic-nucleotide 2'-phosphodiesterase (5'-nucleotidase family)
MTFTQKTGDMLEYLDEARKKYGPVVDETLAKVESWGADTFKEVQHEGESILRELAEMVKNTPEDPRVQALVEKYHTHLNRFHATSKDMLSKISDLYTSDERFAAYFQRFDGSLAVFLQKAIKEYTKHDTKDSHSK